jgi:hypothetical protein
VQKEGDKPMAFSFEGRGEDFFGLTYMQQLDNFFAPFQARKTDSNATRYKIVEDTDDRLVAIYAYPFEPYKDTVIDFVVIDKNECQRGSGKHSNELTPLTNTSRSRGTHSARAQWNNALPTWQRLTRRRTTDHHD